MHTSSGSILLRILRRSSGSGSIERNFSSFWANDIFNAKVCVQDKFANHTLSIREVTNMNLFCLKTLQITWSNWNSSRTSKIHKIYSIPTEFFLNHRAQTRRKFPLKNFCDVGIKFNLFIWSYSMPSEIFILVTVT